MNKFRVLAVIEFDVPEDYVPQEHNSGDGVGFAYAYEELNANIDGVEIIEVVDNVDFSADARTV